MNEGWSFGALPTLAVPRRMPADRLPPRFDGRRRWIWLGVGRLFRPPRSWNDTDGVLMAQSLPIGLYVYWKA